MYVPRMCSRSTSYRMYCAIPKVFLNNFLPFGPAQNGGGVLSKGECYTGSLIKKSTFFKLYDCKKKDYIPVGCVPPACWLHLPACTVQGGACSRGSVCSLGVSAPGECLPPGGCACSQGGYPSMH